MCLPRDSEVSHLTNDKLLFLDRILPAEFGTHGDRFFRLLRGGLFFFVFVNDII